MDTGRRDRRGFVALDPTGEVRSVNKDITGLPAAKVRERLADLDAEHLPSIDDARGRMREREPAPALEAEQAREDPQPDIRAVDLRPDSAPVHQAERDQVDELAAYAERQQQGFQEARRIRAEFEAAAKTQEMVVTRIAQPSPEAIQRPFHEAEQSATLPKAPEKDVAALLRELDERLRAPFSPPLMREAVPQPVREPEAERVREHARVPEPAAQPAPEFVRPSLFQMLTMGVRACWQGLHSDHAADRQANAVRSPAPVLASVPLPIPRPAPEPERRQQEPTRQPAPEPPQPRPAERLRPSIVDEGLVEARARLAEERARETPEQRAERERRKAERSRGRNDGGRERGHYHHARLWELLHPFQHGHGARHRQRVP